MSRDIYLGAYWSARQESLEECSRRAKMMFNRLLVTDPTFTQWYKRGSSRKDALKHKVDVSDDDQLRTLLLNGRNRRDFDKTVIEELGYSFGLWNGGTSPISASVSVCCGLYTQNQNLSNAVVIDMPKRMEHLENTDVILKLFSATIEAWQPDYAGVIDRRSRNIRHFEFHKPFVDWMVYVADKSVNVSALPKPATAHPVSCGGAIIVVQDEPIQFDNPDHIRNVHAVEKYLGLNPS